MVSSVPRRFSGVSEWELPCGLVALSLMASGALAHPSREDSLPLLSFSLSRLLLGFLSIPSFFFLPEWRAVVLKAVAWAHLLFGAPPRLWPFFERGLLPALSFSLCFSAGYFCVFAPVTRGAHILPLTSLIALSPPFAPLNVCQGLMFPRFLCPFFSTICHCCLKTSACQCNNFFLFSAFLVT